MSTYYLLRRIPETIPARHLIRQLAPLGGSILKSIMWTVLAEVTPDRSPVKETWEENAKASGDEAMEKLQRKYFDQPGLDTLTVRQITKVGRAIGRAGRIYLWSRRATGTDSHGRAQHNLALIPRTGYDVVMLTGLAVGTALGYFSGGQIHSHCWWDSDHPDEPDLPENHPLPSVRRFTPPQNLGDLAADIDDLYWAEAYGQSIKVTRVGEGTKRRWLISVPGTDHSTTQSQPNQADLESNLREELNLPSAMRLGLTRVIHQAMKAEGIAKEDRDQEKVLICGHSQGGMIAVALSAIEPQELGFAVEGVITLGSPARRIKVRPGVIVLAVEHDQDVVPSLDGTPRKEADQRVIYRRRLVRPRQGALFYAHSSSTYTETVRQLENQTLVAPWGNLGKVVFQLREFLPGPAESTRVTHHYTWQEILEPSKGRTWDKFVEIERPEWDPVTFGGEVEVGVDLPELSLAASSKELISKAENMFDITESIWGRGNNGQR